MRSGRQTATQFFDNPILVGTITILIAVVAVYLSYIAENGLPFVPTYTINVDVQNASELVKNADVRVGGARVGQVLVITPEPATRVWPHPFARLHLALDKKLQPLPVDTRYQVRLASVLGGKYLEILPGHARSAGLPDGGTFHLNKNPALNHNVPFVDLDTAFATFGPKTQKGLRSAVAEFGDAFAGRGTQLNDSVYSLRQLIGPLESLLRMFASPQTHLAQFISGTASTAQAFAAVAPRISSLLADGATTFAALQTAGGALGSSIDQLPATESLGTTVLTNAQPVLTDAAAIVQALKPGAALLPEAGRRLDAVITNATPVFKRVPQLASVLQVALSAVDRLARDPAAVQTFKVLGSSDLATFGSSAFNGLGAILRAIAPGQFACNVAGIWIRNFASTVSEGDASGTWIRATPIIDLNQSFESSTPAPDLHTNPYPIEDSSQCQAGNETYSGAQRIGSVPKTGKTVDNTAPPSGVLDRGRAAGLVP